MSSDQQRPEGWCFACGAALYNIPGIRCGFCFSLACVPCCEAAQEIYATCGACEREAAWNRRTDVERGDPFGAAEPEWVHAWNQGVRYRWPVRIVALLVSYVVAEWWGVAGIVLFHFAVRALVLRWLYGGDDE